MNPKWLPLSACLALCFVSGCIGHSASNIKPAINGETFSKIKVGSSTESEVKALLGTPWRTTNYGESYCGCHPVDLQEIWEYRGKDSTGTYKLHLEFDVRGIARIVAKIPDAGDAVRIVASVPDETLASGHHQGGH